MLQNTFILNTFDIIIYIYNYLVVTSVDIGVMMLPFDSSSEWHASETAQVPNRNLILCHLLTDLLPKVMRTEGEHCNQCSTAAYIIIITALREHKQILRKMFSSYKKGEAKESHRKICSQTGKQNAYTCGDHLLLSSVDVSHPTLCSRKCSSHLNSFTSFVNKTDLKLMPLYTFQLKTGF
jgi:hypothetical protein